MTANVSVSNTTSLYQGSGAVNVINSTQALFNRFSNSGNVQFSLINANTQISANAINLNNTGVSAGTYGSDTLIPVFTVQADGRVTGVVNTPISGALGSYGNSNVAAYLPTYTGSLALSSSIVALTSNAATQQVQIDGLTSNAASQAVSINTLNTNAATQATAINTLNANLGAFETYANATFTVSSYGNANVAAYLPTDATIIALQSNAATQAVSINTLISNAATQAVSINALNANLGAFETYANLTFGTSNYSNANVAAYLLTNTGNIAAGNFLSDNYLFANGVNILSTIAPSSTYSNANVASYLPTYSGSLENSSSIINLWANAATQHTEIYNRALISGQVFTGNISAPYVIANTAVKGPGSVPDGGDQYAALVKNSATGYDYSWTTDVHAAKITETVNNTTGSSIAKGTPLYQTGVTGNTPTVAPADASDPAKMPCIGVAGETIAAGAEGFMIVLGNINGVDTSGFTTGDAIYVATGGGYTNVLPQGTTDVVQFLGVVTRVNASSGSGFVTGTLSEETFRRLTATGEFQGWTGNAWVTIPGTYTNSNVAAYLPSYSGDLNSVGNITVAGTLFSDDITATAVLVNGDTTITGNLFVQGNVTTINSNVITTNDKTITVANNISSASLLTGAGMEAGSNAIATLLYDYATNSWQSNVNLYPTSTDTQKLGDAVLRWDSITVKTINSPTVDALDANLGTATTNITTLFANAAAQAGQIDVLDANLGTATTNINTLFSNAASQQTEINGLTSNAAAQAGQIAVLDANLGTATTNITTLFSNAATQAGQIQTIDANIGAFETYANVAIAAATFIGNLAGNPLYDSVNGRVFANAWPFSTPDGTTGGTNNQFTQFIRPTPSYVGNVLQPQSGQTITLATVANIALQSAYSPVRTVNATNMYIQVTPVTANTMFNSDRVRAHNHTLEIVGSNKTWGTMSTASQLQLSTSALQGTINYVGTGEISNLNGVGSILQIIPASGRANVQYATAFNGGLFWQTTGGAYTASNVTYARLVAGSFNPTGNLTITNAVGLHTPSGWASSSTNKYALLNEDGPTIIQTSGNITINNASSYLTNNGITNLIGNTQIGATDRTTNFSGNVNYNSAPPYVTTFFGNVTMGVVSSYNLLRGTTLVQGNIKFDGPYYETVSAMGNQSGTLGINTGVANTFTMTLTGNVTLNTTSFTNLIAGKSITLILTQDGTGGRYLTSNLKYSGGISTLSTAAGAIDVLNMYYDGTNYLASLVKGYQ
jgi:hypothetical protein